MESVDNTPNVTVFAGGETEGSIEKMETEMGEDTYSFKVINNGDGTVSVTEGSVNNSVATGLGPAGKPTELWLKADINDDVVTGASIETSPSTDSETQTSRQIASITWIGDTPTITQGLRGNQSLSSCGSSHEWTSLYG